MHANNDLILILKIFNKFSSFIISNRPHKSTKTSPSRPQSPPSFGSSTPNSPDDMSSALLKKSSSTDTDSSMNNNMFGKFRGFSLKPLPNKSGSNHISGASPIAYVHPVTKVTDNKNNDQSTTKTTNNGPNCVPTKVAPPIPKPPVILKNHNNNNNNSSNKKSPKSTLKKHEANNKQSVNDFIGEPPALPPLNPGQTGRPLISSPILENSTCNRKELDPSKPGAVSLVAQPIRPAPTAPLAVVEPEVLVNPVAKDGKKSKDGPLHRITSFLKKDDKVAVENGTAPKPIPTKPVQKINRRPIDRERLKTIEISGPIPIVGDDLDLAKDDGLNRTQSMRNSNTLDRPRVTKPFGASMRHGLKRPNSIVERPNLPPPPRPPSPKVNEPTKKEIMMGAYEKPPPPKKVEFLISPKKDDMAPLAHISEESSPMTPTDNIYDEIAESPTPPHLNSTSTESMGLLGEIVSEIESRKSDAMYIASTLKRDKSKTLEKQNSKPESFYVNEVNEGSEDEYLTPQSNVSTTSSGYMKPLGLATPVARVAPNSKLLSPDANKSAPPKFPLNQNRVNTSSSNSVISSTNVSTFKPSTEKVSDIKSPNVNKITFSSPITSPTGSQTSTTTLTAVSTSTPSTESPKPTTTAAAPSKPQSLRTYQPYHTTINRPGPYLASIKAKEAEKDSTVTVHKPISLRTRTPSPKGIKTITSPTSNGSVASVKSPDIITNSIPKTKQPDVLNRTASSTNKPKPSAKPTLATSKPPNNSTNSNGSNSGISNTSSNNSTNKPLSSRPTKSSTVVASLQQKFETGKK